MQTTVTDILMTVVILSMAIIGIGLYRQDVEIVQAVVEYSEDIEKVDDSDLLFANRDIVYGSDVISFIRYYANDNSVEVEVNIYTSSKKYIDETYDANEFNIPYEAEFTNKVIYNGKNIKKIVCIKN